MSADNEFIIFYPTCGKPVDKRNLAEVLSHGWWNADTGKYECKIIVDVPDNVLAKKKGDSVQ